MTADSEEDFKALKAIGQGRITEIGDGWSLRTSDNSLGAQFEHTIIVTRGEPILLTL